MIVAFVLLVWFAGAVALQALTPRLERWVLRWDVFMILPRYHLFDRPTPPVELLWCDENGEWRPWRVAPPRGGLGRLWDPDSYRLLVVRELAERVARMAGAPRLESTVAYRALSRALAREPRARRFRLLHAGRPIHENEVRRDG